MTTIAARTIAVVQIFIAFLMLAMSSFADGGALWERLPSLMHPFAAVAFIWLAFTPAPPKNLGEASVILCVSVAGFYAALSVAILIGAIRGDFYIPLALGVIPLLCVPYAASRVRAAA